MSWGILLSKDSIYCIFQCVGEDPTREGLIKTPERMAKALLDCTSGYETNLEEIANNAIFSEDYDEMVCLL